MSSARQCVFSFNVIALSILIHIMFKPCFFLSMSDTYTRARIRRKMLMRNSINHTFLPAIQAENSNDVHSKENSKIVIMRQKKNYTFFLVVLSALNLFELNN